MSECSEALEKRALAFFKTFGRTRFDAFILAMLRVANKIYRMLDTVVFIMTPVNVVVFHMTPVTVVVFNMTPVPKS